MVHMSIIPSHLSFLNNTEVILVALWPTVGILNYLSGLGLSGEAAGLQGPSAEGDHFLAILNKLTTQATLPGAAESLAAQQTTDLFPGVGCSDLCPPGLRPGVSIPWHQALCQELGQ